MRGERRGGSERRQGSAAGGENKGGQEGWEAKSERRDRNTEEDGGSEGRERDKLTKETGEKILRE